MNNFIIFVLGIIAGIVVSIGIELFRFYFLRPRLSIDSDNPEDSAQYSCHSVRILNSGRRVAQNVQGAISFFDLEPHDILVDSQVQLGNDLDLDSAKFGVSGPETVFLRSGTFREINQEPLCWAAVNSRRSIDIFPGTNRLLDVCRFVKVQGKHQIHIPTADGWQYLLVVLVPKNYKIEVRVAANDGKVVLKRFTIRYTANSVQLTSGWERT